MHKQQTVRSTTHFQSGKQTLTPQTNNTTLPLRACTTRLTGDLSWRKQTKRRI